jgi:hypothetical protein
MKDLLVILAILVFCLELYRLLRGYWIQRILKKKREARKLRKPRVMKPKSERDCPFCMEEKGKQGSSQPGIPMAWGLRKSCGGPKKKIPTTGFFCPNRDCEYYGITDENIHALVGYGYHGKQELIRDFKCQACRKKFTSQKNTVLYRLKTRSWLVEAIM